MGIQRAFKNRPDDLARGTPDHVERRLTRGCYPLECRNPAKAFASDCRIEPPGYWIQR